MLFCQLHIFIGRQLALASYFMFSDHLETYKPALNWDKWSHICSLNTCRQDSRLPDGSIKMYGTVISEKESTQVWLLDIVIMGSLRVIVSFQNLLLAENCKI